MERWKRGMAMPKSVLARYRDPDGRAAAVIRGVKRPEACLDTGDECRPDSWTRRASQRPMLDACMRKRRRLRYQYGGQGHPSIPPRTLEILVDELQPTSLAGSTKRPLLTRTQRFVSIPTIELAG